MRIKLKSIVKLYEYTDKKVYRMLNFSNQIKIKHDKITRARLNYWIIVEVILAKELDITT